MLAGLLASGVVFHRELTRYVIQLPIAPFTDTFRLAVPEPGRLTAHRSSAEPDTEATVD